MNIRFSYSILKYVHSQFIGEELNIGILFVFPEHNRVDFLAPKSLNRIKRVYQDASIDVLRRYLSSFRNEVKKSKKILHLYQHGYDELISERFITSDASSLQFTKFNNAIAPYGIERVLEYYYDSYLKYYDENHSKEKPRITDHLLAAKCKEEIRKINPQLEQYLITDPQFVIESNKIRFKPDLRWQNGTLNLIKGLSFDLSNEDEITNKALLMDNKLQFLEEEIVDKGARIDFLVSQPQNQELLEAYNTALNILQSNNAPKNIIIHDNLHEYALKVAQEIER